MVLVSIHQPHLSPAAEIFNKVDILYSWDSADADLSTRTNYRRILGLNHRHNNVANRNTTAVRELAVESQP